jgi:hypothetical protein
MDNFSFWQRWLFIAACIIVLFGLSMAFFNQSKLFDLLLNRQINLVFWGSAQASPDIIAFQRFVYGVLGATMAGWGIFLGFISHYPYKKREPWAWNCVISGMTVWYVVDTTISIASDVIFNALLNTSIFLLVLLPLFFTRKAFR